ncbi:MAG: hypothetical protein JNK82_10580 [Myxococcaceae bacterium]|nr:hypothetical protein [Myxococcaceae bacterium]
MPRRLRFVFGALALVACGPAAPTRGTVLGDGVAEAWFEVRANATDLVPVRVVFPSDEAGVPRARAARGLVFIQGGLVAEGRYVWLARALAARGVVVALPRHVADLAILSAENGRAAGGLLRDGPGLLAGAVHPEHVAVAGHSLGAVVAGKLMLGADFTSVSYLAGYPEASDVAALSAQRGPALAIAGTADCTAKLPDVRGSLSGLGPLRLIELEGVTHYQFTDSDAQDVSSGCVPGVALDTAHRLIADALFDFIGARP